MSKINPNKFFYGYNSIKDKRKVIDFWKWVISDLKEKTNMGMLAEFLVSWSINTDNKPKQYWKPYDLKTKNGKRIEVKFTSTNFVIKPTKRPDKFNRLTKKATFNADIYVLCYFKNAEKDPINLSNWKFWVFPKKKMRKLLNEKKSISIKKLESSKNKGLKFNELRKLLRIF